MSEQQTTHPEPEQEGPRGIGGWLILLAIGEVLGPFQILTGMISEYASIPDGTFARMPVAFIGDCLIRLALIGVLVYSAYLFFNKRREFPRFFVISVLCSLATPILLTVWVTATSGVNTMPALGTADFLQPYLLALVVSGIWIAYVVNSVRVKNTFVE